MADFLTPFIELYLKGQCILLPLILLLRMGEKKSHMRFQWSLYAVLLAASFCVPLVLSVLGPMNAPVEVIIPYGQNASDIAQSPEIGEKTGELTFYSGRTHDVTITTPLVKVRREGISSRQAEETTTFFTLFQNEVVRKGRGIILLLCVIASCIGLFLFLVQVVKQRSVEKQIERRAGCMKKVGNVTLVFAQSVAVPFTSLLGGATVYLPVSLLEERKALKRILRHELCHIKENHLVWNIISTIHRYLFWYNPLAHVLHKAGEFSQECICDQAAVKEKNVIPYIRTLLTAAENYLENHNQLAIGASFNPQNMLLRRIIYMKNYISHKPKKRVLSTGLALVLSGLLFLTLSAGAFAQENEAVLAALELESREEVAAYVDEHFEGIDKGLNSQRREDGTILVHKEFTVKNPVTGEDSSFSIRTVADPFMWPIKDANAPGRVTNPWGMVMHPFQGRLYFHRGIDISNGRFGSEIPAGQKGRVVKVDFQPAGRGHYVVIEHENNFSTYYCQMKSVSVNEGDLVEQGDSIGLVGSSGASTGPHVHFEIRYLDLPVDPAAFLGL